MPYRLTLLFVLLLAAPLGAQPAPDQQAGSRPGLTPAEQAFAAAMSGAVMQGAFTVGDHPDQPPRAERYDLGQVTKVGDGVWQFPVRIRYGDHDVQLPISLPVDFAGDTAVIRVDNVGFPGLGVYSARVLIHDHRYAGYWHGSGHGGHLFGELKRAEQKPQP